MTKLFEEERDRIRPNLAVSPDEEWILYSKSPLPVSELMPMENFR